MLWRGGFCNINWGIWNPGYLIGGYIAESVRGEIQRVNSIDRQVLLKKRSKIQEDSVTLVLTLHPALYITFNILKSAHQIIENSPPLKPILQKPPRIAVRNRKTLRDKLVRSKLWPDYEEERGVFICGRGNCDIWMNLMNLGKYIKKIHFHCNSESVEYLLTCKICRKQYVGSTVAKFRPHFNQYNSYIELYRKGKRNFKQEKFIQHFYSKNYNGTDQDSHVKIIVDICDPNVQEKRENVWMNKVRTLYPEGLNYKRINHY